MSRPFSAPARLFLLLFLGVLAIPALAAGGPVGLGAEGSGEGSGSGMGSGEGSGEGSGGGPVDVTPSVDSLAPAVLRRGVRTEVVVRGTALEQVTRVQVEGSDVVVDELVASLDGTVLRFRVGTGATATAGPRDVTLEGVAITLPDALDVVPGPIDVLSLTPNSGTRGATVTMAVAGANLDEIDTFSFGPNIEVVSWAATSPTRGTVVVRVEEGAFSGPRSVEALSSSDRFVLEAGFEVVGGAAALTSVNPASGTRGETLSVRLVGANLDALTSVGFGPRITVSDYRVNTPTEATATLTIRSDASAGPRDVSLREGDSSTTATGAFTVLRGAIDVLELRPNRLRQRDATFVTIEGSNLDGLTSFDAGPGIEVVAINAALPTSVTVDLVIAADAEVSQRDVTLTAPAGTITIPDGLIIAPYERPQPDLRFIDRIEVGDVMLGGSGRASLTVENRGAIDETFTINAVEGDTDMFFWLDADGRLVAAPEVTVASGAVATLELVFVPTLRGRRGVRFELGFDDPQVTETLSVDAFGNGTNAELLFSVESPADFGELAAGEATALPRLFTRLANGVPSRETIIEGYELRLFVDDAPADPALVTVEFFSTASELYWGVTEIDWSVSGPPGVYTGVLSVLTDKPSARYRELTFTFTRTGDPIADADADAGVDAGSDAGTDAGGDAGSDAGADSGTDAGADVGMPDGTPSTDAGADASADAGTDTEDTEPSEGGSDGGCSTTGRTPTAGWMLLALAALGLRDRRRI